LLSAIDSYYEYCTGRMVTINPSRKMAGILDGQDWPSNLVQMESFYLLTLGQRPLGKQFWSGTVPVLAHTLQWSWMISGTDLKNSKVGRNRGDRYRTNLTMREELLRASWPWFTEKLTWSVQGSTPSGLALQSQSLNPKESIWWTELTFMNRLDRASGLIYGTATVFLTDMDAAITS
jgi:hypothetical protein